MGRNIPGGNFPGGNCPEGSLMGGNFSGGNFPRTVNDIDSSLTNTNDSILTHFLLFGKVSLGTLHLQTQSY